MKTPCRNCPFRIDRIFPLSQARRSQIADGLFNDADFPCHKTFDDPEKAKRCTGAAIFLENARPGGLMSNLSFRIAIITNEIEPNKSDRTAPIAKTRQEFEQAYND